MTVDPYGWSHRRIRRELLAELRRKGGAPCPRCGGLMVWAIRDRLDVGHEVDVAAGGAEGPRRLEHSRCNRAAGAAAGNRARGGARVLVAVEERGLHVDDVAAWIEDEEP
jgi:hypothetical protein